MGAIRTILDVDTGVDDALAIMFACRHPAIDLVGITCVGGNTSLDNVVANTLHVLDTANVTDVPVCRGAERPLVRRAADASHVHGPNGLGNIEVPRARREDARRAIEFYRDTLLGSSKPTTIVALAPLTNLAIALSAYPEMSRSIERIVFMGGSVGLGNITATAEFNTWSDPEALRIVLESGIPLTMYGLDVFYSAAVPLDIVDGLPESEDRMASLLGRLLKYYGATGINRGRVDEGMVNIGDAGALCLLVEPSHATIRTAPLSVNLEGEARGQTIADFRKPFEDMPEPPFYSGTPIDIALAVEGRYYGQLFLDTCLGIRRT